MDKNTQLKKYPRAFLTGCDQNTEWMLDWFLENYYRHNFTPIVFADFGVSKKKLNNLINEKKVAAIVDLTGAQEKGWFKKPLSMWNSPTDETCWIDTDCHVLGDLGKIWSYVEDNKLAMVEDKPWSKRRGEKWHNSGVVAFRGKPQILKKWIEAVRQNPTVGDQEVLHAMLSSPLDKLVNITDLPNVYNWLRIQVEHDKQDSKDKLVMHWTGQKGKDKIREMMNA
jgi:hypothetical protein